MQIQSFPVIGYSEILSGSITPEQILETLDSTGFCYLSDVDEVISPQLFKAVQDVSQRLSGLRPEPEMQYYIGVRSANTGSCALTYGVWVCADMAMGSSANL